MPTNEFKVFAGEGTVDNEDVLSPSAYANDSDRTIGNQVGIARRELINTTLRQATTVIAAIAQFVAENQSADVLDDGDPDQIKTKFQNAVQTLAAASSGDVSGPTSSTVGGIALFADTSGKNLKLNDTGKGLSTNDFTTAEKTKLAGVDAGAEVNVIESIKLNGVTQTVSNKEVNLLVEAGSEIAVSTDVQAKAGTDDSTFMSPLKVKTVNGRFPVTTLGTSGTQELNLSAGIRDFYLSPAGTVTLTISSKPTDAFTYTYCLRIDMGATLHTINFPSTWKFNGGSAPTLAVNRYYEFIISVYGGETYELVSVMECY